MISRKIVFALMAIAISAYVVDSFQGEHYKLARGYLFLLWVASGGMGYIIGKYTHKKEQEGARLGFFLIGLIYLILVALLFAQRTFFHSKVLGLLLESVVLFSVLFYNYLSFSKA